MTNLKITRLFFALALMCLFGCISTQSNPISDCIDPDKINPDGICPMIYMPVCGCDGKTYGNECEANNAGLISWESGRCKQIEACIDESRIQPDMPCSGEYDPVCACDGNTYSNVCQAKKLGITKWEKGECNVQKAVSEDCIDPTKIDAKQGCNKIYRPVCGCDGKTYGNECEAKKAGITKWEKGKCQ